MNPQWRHIAVKVVCTLLKLDCVGGVAKVTEEIHVPAFSKHHLTSKLDPLFLRGFTTFFSEGNKFCPSC